jgi:hypothetical protein
MELYAVTVRNEFTGEIDTVSVIACGPKTAQVEALGLLFRGRRWRKCVAFPPSIQPSPITAEPQNEPLPVP